MKSASKIIVFLFFQIFLFPIMVFFVQFLIDYYLLGLSEPFRRPTWLGMVIMLMGPYFFTYSKWANNNIWNTKTSKPTNESINPINPNDENQQVLDNIENVLSSSNDNSKDALQKIEELKRQIENIEQSIKNNDSNSEIESPELSEEELKEEEKNYGEGWKKSDNFDHRIGIDSQITFWIVAILLMLTIIGTIIYGTNN